MVHYSEGPYPDENKGPCPVCGNEEVHPRTGECPAKLVKVKAKEIPHPFYDRKTGSHKDPYI